MGKITKFFAESALVIGLTNMATKPTELFPGVEKPTVTLAKMLVLEMMQNLDALKKDSYHSGYVREHTYHFPSFTLQVLETEAHTSGNNNNKPRKIPASTKISLCRLKNNNYLHGDVEFNILSKGLTEFKRLQNGREALLAEERRQKAAIDAIENFFKPKENPE